jgi:hypothetical protein
MPMASGRQSRKTGKASCNSFRSWRALWAGTGLAVAVVMSSGAEKGKAALSSGPAARPDLQCAGVPAIRSLPGVPPGGQK